MPNPTHRRAGTDGASLTDQPAAKYIGTRTAEGTTVVREDAAGVARPLSPRTDIRNHSPTGLEWGYSGSGPAQLALAILADAIGPDRAEPIYQQFKFRIVAGLPADRWELTRASVLSWVAENERPRELS